MLTFIEDDNAKDNLSGCKEELKPKVGTFKLLTSSLVEVLLCTVVHQRATFTSIKPLLMVTNTKTSLARAL
jgi:hypothetical protein